MLLQNYGCEKFLTCFHTPNIEIKIMEKPCTGIFLQNGLFCNYNSCPLAHQSILHHYLVVFYYIIAYTHTAWMIEFLKSNCSNLSELYIWEWFQI
jgi:hypothetical protein